MTTVRPSTPPSCCTLDRSTAMQLAATEYDRYLDQLHGLSPHEWSLPTDCPAWDIRALATHNLGMAEMAASTWEILRQFGAAARRGGVFIDALTDFQVQDRAGLDPAQILARYAAATPQAARGRRRTPGLVRRLPMPVTQPVGAGLERWTVGYLLDTILTRDTWMHRVDTARATGRELVLTAEHDGVLVTDVVTEWAARHGAPCTLRLTGPAGSRWTFATGGPELEFDAVDFCRILARRAPGTGLLDVEVPF